MALFASGIKTLDPLKSPLGDIASKRQLALQTQIGALGDQARNSARASGRVQGNYLTQELGRSGTRASAGINDALLGILGNASLKDFNSQRDFEQNMRLAKETGALNKPSTLEEILGGLGSAANVAGKFAPLYSKLKGSISPQSYPVTYGKYSDIQPGYMSFQDPYLEELFNGR